MIVRITLDVNRKNIKLRAVSLPKLSYLSINVQLIRKITQLHFRATLCCIRGIISASPESLMQRNVVA